MGRTWMGVALAVAVCALSWTSAVAGPQEKGEPKGPLPRWAPSLEKALALAKERGGAVMIALNMDGESGNQGMVDHVYRQKPVLEAAKTCVVAIASIGKHAETKDPLTGRSVCSRFGSVTCAEHQVLEKIVREEWLKRGPDQDVESPRHFLLAPDGRILFQRTWTVGEEELAAMMKRANELCTEETLAAWDTPEARLARAVDPLPLLRQQTLRELLAEKDDALDAKIVALAAKKKDPAIRSDVASELVKAGGKRLALAYGFLKDKEPKVRLRTAYSLEKRGDAEAVAALLGRAGKDRDEGVRAAVYRALGACGGGSKKVRDALLKAGKKKKDASAPHAIVALAPWGTDPPVIKALIKMPWGKYDDDVRKAACWVLGLSGRKDLVARFEELAKEDSAVEYVASMAAKHLAGNYDGKQYRGAASWVVRHPVYDAY